MVISTLKPDSGFTVVVFDFATDGVLEHIFCLLNVALGSDGQTNDLTYMLINRRRKRTVDDDHRPGQNQRDGGVSHCGIWRAAKTAEAVSTQNR